MPDLLKSIWIIIQVIIGFNLVFPLFLFTLYSLFKKNKLVNTNTSLYDYAIIITAYKYVNTLPSVVASVLKLNYSNFLVYVVADNCDTSSLNFDDERVILLQPDQILSSNTKSHFYAINRFRRDHTILTIIDSDNIVEPDYLNQINPYFAAGFEAVQGHRGAKNLDTTYACLDAARDIYYHFYDCKILFNIGSSSTLSGSGMAFTVKLFKECLENLEIQGAGFDKVLQSLIVKRNKRIAYSANAFVYDEKTSMPDELINQRSRWINTWFKYFRFGFGLFAKGIKNLSVNQSLFGLVLLRPPLFIFLILSLILMLVNFLIWPLLGVIWLGAFLIFLVSFMLSLRMSDTDVRIYKSLIGIPRFIFYQLISLTKARKANIRSVSTRHHHN